MRVPADRLVGGENKGWECILGGLQLERIASTAGYCGGVQSVVDMALAYAKERIANMGMQILGAYGYSMEYDMLRHFRDARSTTIGAGTSQMQRNTIAGLMGVKVQ